MRASTVFRLFSCAAIFVAAVIWFHGRTTAAALEARSMALHSQEEQLARLRMERDRLRGQLNILAGRRLDRSRPVVANRAPNPAENSASTDTLAIGRWTPVAAWKNEGRSTPRSTVSTLLWAAAGGDLRTMQKLLQFNDAARNQARTWFEGLPPATRSLYASPEDLVASVTMGSIPSTNVQLSWFHQADADHAIVGVMLAAPTSSGPDSTPAIKPSVGNEPPFMTNHGANQLAVLDLVRDTDGWRVVVPVPAIKRMAKVLSVTAAH